MGQHQIVDKLKLEFAGEITSERQVVYILVEIGKLLEHETPRAPTPRSHSIGIGSFIRNWIALPLPTAWCAYSTTTLPATTPLPPIS